MCDSEPDWKVERIQALKESLTALSNAEKLNREKWVVRRLLRALSVEFEEKELAGADEPADVVFRDSRFQVKEILDKGRYRADEFKMKLKAAELAQEYSELLENYTPKDISFSEVVQHCYDYAEMLTSQVKYGQRESKNMDILFYFNWLDYHVVPPVEVPSKEIAFRSLSIVSNRYCAIAYASKDAPKLLRDNAGRAMEYFET